MPKILLLDRKRVANPVERVYLKQTNAQVLLVEKADVAVQRALREKPDLIMVANSFDGNSGMQILENLRKEFQLKPVPIFFMGIPEERDKAQELGATAFLPDPVPKEILVEALKTHTKLKIRLATRYPMALRVSYKTDNHEEGEAMTRDISTGGIFLEVDPPFFMKTSVELKIILNLIGEEPVLHCSGTVVRAVRKDTNPDAEVNGCGIRFSENDDRARLMIGAFLRNRGLER